MTNKNIFREMGGLDPDLIMKAAPAEKAKKKSLKNVWVKWGAIAACFALMLSIGIPLGINLIQDYTENDVYSFTSLKTGESVDFKSGSVSYDTLDEHSLTFTLVIDKAITARKLAMNAYVEYADGTVEFIDTEDERYYNLLDITVNGNSCSRNDMPMEIGTYIITVDFSKLIEADGKLVLCDFVMVDIAGLDVYYYE